MLSWIREILKNPRYAFLVALVSRPAGLLVFSIWIAHRWSFAEIAQFESFSVFQFLLFFAWLPAWGNVCLMQTPREDELLQKPFLFSNVLFGWILVSVCFLAFSLFWTSFLPGIDRTNHAITIYLLICFYYFLQVYIFKNYLEGSLAIQWLLAAAIFFSSVLLGLITTDFEMYMRYQVVVYALILLILKRGKFYPVRIQWKFWKEVMVYGIYSLTGGLGPVLAAYLVQSGFGLGNELNWFRYGTRELPVLPAWLAGFGQSHLTGNPDSGIPVQILKKGINSQIRLILLPLFLLILFSKPIFYFLFGPSFIPASYLMSIFLLIYIPRMIFSQIVLQWRQRTRSLLYSGVVELAFMIAAALIWFPDYGLEALAWIMVAGSLLEKVIQMAILWFKEGIAPDQYVPVTSFILYTLCLAAAFVIKSSV